MKFRTATIRPVVAELDEPEYIEFKAGHRTTMVVTRVVVEMLELSSEIRQVDVYGYRKEHPATYAGFRNPGR